MRFLTAIDQPPFHDIGRRQVGHIHKRDTTAQIGGEDKYIVGKLLDCLTL